MYCSVDVFNINSGKHVYQKIFNASDLYTFNCEVSNLEQIAVNYSTAIINDFLIPWNEHWYLSDNLPFELIVLIYKNKDDNLSKTTLTDENFDNYQEILSKEIIKNIIKSLNMQKNNV